MVGSYPGAESRKWSGSSAAAPIVSGLLALMIEADPNASSNDLIQRLISTAADRGEKGYDKDFGYGLIFPASAVSSRLTSLENPLGSLASWIELYRPSAPVDQAELLIPPQSGPIAAENQPLAAEPGADPWSNPLLYVLVVPLALLLAIVLRNRFGRDGKKTRR